MYIILYVIPLLFATGTIAIFSSMHAARKSAAPFFPTPKKAIREALKAVGLRPGEIFYDLGAGTGRTMVIAEKEFGGAATGFEMSLLPYAIAKINIFLHGARSKIIAKDFFRQSLDDADVVFCFLAIRTMKKMEDKLKAELKPGARVIVYAFPLPTLNPIKTITVSGKWQLFIYIK